MKLTINTERFKEMLSKATQGASENKLLPITCMIGIDVSNQKLRLTTTDSTNYLYILGDVPDAEDFSVTVYADIFAKLISRMACEMVTLTVTDKYLEVNGNGTYKIDLPFDENGEVIKFPNPVEKIEEQSSTTSVELTTIQTVLSAVKPAISVTYEAPQYTNYWIGDSVVATDSYKVASYSVPVFEIPRLVSSAMMNLLSVMTDKEIEVIELDDTLVFKSSNCIVYGKTPSGMNEFSIDAIKGLVNSDFTSTCEISRNIMLQLLDRLSLFIKPFDDDSIKLTFSKDGLIVTSLTESGSELIPYLTNEEIEDFSCSVNINLLQTQIKSNISDSVKLSFGREECIKITDGMITKIVALND